MTAISRIDLNGSTENSTILQRDAVSSLVVDKYHDKLYWLEGLNQIYYSELDGSNVRLLNFKSNYWLEMFMVDKEYVYYRKYFPFLGSADIYYIRRANKFTGVIDNNFKVVPKHEDEVPELKYVSSATY